MYLMGAVAKDFGENLCREEGDDGQEDCYASCDNNDDVDYGQLYNRKKMKERTIMKETNS